MSRARPIRRLSPSPLGVGLVWLAATVTVGAAASLLLGAVSFLLAVVVGLAAGQFWAVFVLTSAVCLAVIAVVVMRLAQAAGAHLRRIGRS